MPGVAGVLLHAGKKLPSVKLSGERWETVRHSLDVVTWLPGFTWSWSLALCDSVCICFSYLRQCWFIFVTLNQDLWLVMDFLASPNYCKFFMFVCLYFQYRTYISASQPRHGSSFVPNLDKIPSTSLSYLDRILFLSVPVVQCHKPVPYSLKDYFRCPLLFFLFLLDRLLRAALTSLKLPIETRVSMSSQRSSCLCLPVIYHHGQLPSYLSV